LEQILKIQSGQIELVASLHVPENRSGSGKVPLVIICHGFVGSRIGVNRLFVKAARNFASQGFAVLRFDFEGCGESPGEYGSYSLERFIQQTVNVIDFGASLEFVDTKQIILLGHSLGGAVAVHTAVRDKRIKKLVMWAAVGHPFHDIVNIVGYDEYQRSLTVPFIDHEGFALTKDFFEPLQDFSPYKESELFAGDVFLAHGTGDKVIPVDYCSLYYHAFKRGAALSCQKEIIPNADHTFSSVKESNRLFQSTLHWLLDHTNREGIWSPKAI
jgi:uncharacterized protein